MAIVTKYVVGHTNHTPHTPIAILYECSFTEHVHKTVLDWLHGYCYISDQASLMYNGNLLREQFFVNQMILLSEEMFVNFECIISD